MPIIEKSNLKFSTLTKRQKTSRIIIHHSDSDRDTTIEDIHGWHKNKGWSGVGYHFAVYPNGRILEGRPLTAMGAHAEGSNADSIGIVLIGNFEKAPPTQDQLNSLVWLVKYIRTEYKSELLVFRHSDVMATACPGRLFPWEYFKKELSGGGSVSAKSMEPWKKEIMDKAKALGIITSDHDPDEPSPKWFVLAVVNKLMEAKK